MGYNYFVYIFGKEFLLAFSPFTWFINKILGVFSLDIAIDLGTANTLVAVHGKGIVINEPSWVAVEKRTKQPLAIGRSAKEMQGRAPASVSVIRPLRDGVISDFDMARLMLEYFIGKVHEQSAVPFPSPRVVVGIPAGVTEVEKRAVYDAARAAGAREAYLIEEPIAAAIGAGLPINDILGSMVVDIGGGTTEVAVLSSGGVVAARSLRVAGDEMNEAIVQYIRNKYNLLIGESVAEKLKMEIGSAYPMTPEKVAEVRGRNLITGLPETIEVSSVEMREALAASVQVIVDTVRDLLDEVPPETIADLMDVGIALAGGGALIQGLDQYLSSELNLRAWVSEDPLTCVVRGANMVFDDFDTYSHFLAGLERGSTRHQASGA